MFLWLFSCDGSAIILQHFWTVEYSASLASSETFGHCTHGTSHLWFSHSLCLAQRGVRSTWPFSLLLPWNWRSIGTRENFSTKHYMTFLGHEIDSIAMEVRLPLDKLHKCRDLIQTCCQRPKLTLRNLQSIFGTLIFSCAVIMPGRAFLRRLIDLTIGVSKPFHFTRNTKQVRDDLQLWGSFLK